MCRIKPIVVHLVILCWILFLNPTITFADASQVTVVYLGGLCNNSMTCNSQYYATNAIQPKLAPGTQLLAPDSKVGYLPGHFGTEAAANSFAQSLNGKKLVFIAYSAGDWGLAQILNQMDENQLKQIKSIILLEPGNPSQSTPALARLVKVNPTVKIVRLGTAQLGGNHSSLPGSSGLADATSILASAAANDTTPVLPASYTATPPASTYSPVTAGGYTGYSGSGNTYTPTGGSYSTSGATPVSYTTPSTQSPYNSILYQTSGSSLPQQTGYSSISSDNAYTPSDYLNTHTVATDSSQSLFSSIPTSGGPTSTDIPLNGTTSPAAPGDRRYNMSQTFPPDSNTDVASDSAQTDNTNATDTTDQAPGPTVFDDTFTSLLSTIKTIIERLQNILLNLGN